MRRALLVGLLIAAFVGATSAPAEAERAESRPEVAKTSTSAGRATYSPYALAPSSYFRGELHAHSKLSDGTEAPGAVLAAYRDIGCRWVAITDHDQVTKAWVPQMVEIPACERTVRPTDAGFSHMLLFGLSSVPASRGMVQNVAAAEFSTLAHPVWGGRWGKWTVKEALASRVTAIEIYNPFSDGPGCEALWDACLSRGAAPFCTVGDDEHGSPSPERHVGAYAVVFSDELSATSLLQSLAKGSYYCTLGPELSIVDDESRLTVSSPDTCDWLFVGANGKVLQRDFGTSVASYEFNGTEKYVRCKAIRLSDAKPAWTNPVFFAQWQASVATSDGRARTAVPWVAMSVNASSDLAPVVDMRVRSDAQAWPAWQPYGHDITCPLSAGDGLKVVHVEFRDRFGTVFRGPDRRVRLDTSRPLATGPEATSHPDPAR